MKNINKKLFAQVTLSSMLLITMGCAPKSANGTYVSAYSYHPYLKNKNLKNKKQTKTQRTTLAYQSLRTYPMAQKRTITRSITKPTQAIVKQNPFKVILAKPSLARPMNISSKPTLFQQAIKPHYKTRNSSVPSTHSTINNIENTAKSLLGIKYHYGANGPYEYDCSSFTKYVFAKQGINLPRVSRDQAQRGQFVASGQLQKGDLIFFDSKKSTKVSHVGIYLGNGDFIHASSAKNRVTISNLRSNYYSKHFKWGRRVIQPHYNYAMR